MDTFTNIYCSDFQEATITIYDRYGKLIKQFSSKTIGWDGKYNGVNLYSTDYWFTVEYKQNGLDKIFKSHFAMKR
jgi:gliding motility-associated-like protein